VQSASPAKRFTLADIVSTTTGRPNAYLLYAVEGWGKTSLASKTPRPIFLQSRGETGLDTLIHNGLVAETPHFPECNTWQDALDAVDVLLDEDHGFRCLPIDTVNGLERLCFEHVCTRDFGGDWGERGFASYGKGPQVAVAEWLMFLQKLDKLRAQKGMTIFMLSHAKVITFKNPEGADYDRYQADMDKNIYSITAKWADAVLFGNFQVTVNTKKAGDAKGKAVDKFRTLYTERGPAFDGKNRMGMPPEIDMGENPDEAWANFKASLVRPTATEGETTNA
jgi:hypothetical protein